MRSSYCYFVGRSCFLRTPKRRRSCEIWRFEASRKLKLPECPNYQSCRSVCCHRTLPVHECSSPYFCSCDEECRDNFLFLLFDFFFFFFSFSFVRSLARWRKLPKMLWVEYRRTLFISPSLLLEMQVSKKERDCNCCKMVREERKVFYNVSIFFLSTLTFFGRQINFRKKTNSKITCLRKDDFIIISENSISTVILDSPYAISAEDIQIFLFFLLLLY